MERLQGFIEGKKRWSGLKDQILLVQENKETNTNISLDGAKTILETICKTILNDKGVEFKSDIKLNALVKITFDGLPVFKKLSSKDKETTKSILSSLENIAKGIGTFRNTHGFFSHGQDLEAKKFDIYLTNLVIESSDLLSSFLILSHSEGLINNHRIYYEDYDVFNEWMDVTEEWLEVRGILCSPSLTLFNSDIEAYKSAVIDFNNNPDDLTNALEILNDDKTEKVTNGIINIKDIFNNDQLEELSRVIKESQTISKEMIDKINDSGVFKTVKKMQEDIKKVSDSMNEALKPTRELVEVIGKINNK